MRGSDLIRASFREITRGNGEGAEEGKGQRPRRLGNRAPGLRAVSSARNKMEKNLDKILEEIVASDDVTGCLVSDKQGLCLGMRGEVNAESSGALTAIVEQARNLNRGSKENPVVVLETTDKQCIIQSNEKLVVSIMKNMS